MNKILFICRKQFGYSIDNYYHCKYLSSHYQIDYLSPHVGWKNIELENVNPIYVYFQNNRYLNNIRFYLKAIKQINQGKNDLVILNRSFFFFVFKILCPHQTFIYDIRSGIVSQSKIKRFLYTLLIKIDLLFFRYRTIISDSLAQKLKIKNYIVLPLGAERFHLTPKTFENIKLVYIGTFNNRNIEVTIKGFYQFINSWKVQKKVTYHIYGFGDPVTERKIIHTISRYHLEQSVFFHGKIHPSEVEDTLAKYNVGISFVPITSYFTVQPPTKTFEYLLAGMPVLATNTLENGKVIDADNGVIITDTAESFSNGLCTLIGNIEQGQYSSPLIKRKSYKYSWDYIVMNLFSPYIKKLINS